MKGVNLGNWLVLEKWMSPTLFSGTDAEDETSLCLQLDDATKRERYKAHRDTWITDRDFVYLASKGIEFVRLPVPYFVFGDHALFIGCIDFVDAAFGWAAQHDIGILLDLHTVPESQNGFDNGGLCGVCKFHRNPSHVRVALDVLEQLTIRYRDNPHLWGIEVLNEPISPELWDLLDVPNRYPAADKVQAEGSEAVPTEFLKRFYRDAYAAIRAHSEDVRIVFHDGFRIREWTSFLSEPDFRNFVVDTHMYVMMAGPRLDLAGYLEYVDTTFGDTIREMSQQFPIMVGEWCIDTKAVAAQTLARNDRIDYFRTVGAAHQRAFAPAIASSYWSYKLIGDEPVNDLWDFLKATELRYLETR